MDDIFTAINPSNCIKTYSKPDRTAKVTEALATLPQPQLPLPSVSKREHVDETSKGLKREPLTTKDAVSLLLEGTLKSKVCRYCLNVTADLSELDRIYQVADKGTLYKVSLKDMVASFHPFKIIDDPNLPDKLCNKCVDRTIAAYLFTQQCERAERALRNYFDDIYEKFDKLDPLEKPKHKRGRQKLHPNTNKLYVEHKNVIDYAHPIIHIVNTATEPIYDQPNIKEFECLKCCEVMPNLTALLNHTKIHPKTMWYNCRLCGKSFPKRHHLTKHWKSEHSKVQKSPEKKEIIKYECKRCGMLTEKYYDYLQHIEKHKFKLVMEHVVEKNMDKLCSVCLNKDSDMISLDRTIALHGGCPELTGEKRLYDIVGATLPEKMNKYQELIVPRKVSIIKICKRKTVKRQKTNDFIFTDPNILSEENLDCDHLYTFLFAEPLMNVSKITEIRDVIPIIDKNTEISDKNADKHIEAMAIELENKDFYGIQYSQQICSNDPKIVTSGVNNIIHENNTLVTNQAEKLEQEQDKYDWIFDKTKSSIANNVNVEITFPFAEPLVTMSKISEMSDDITNENNIEVSNKNADNNNENMAIEVENKASYDIQYSQKICSNEPNIVTSDINIIIHNNNEALKQEQDKYDWIFDKTKPLIANKVNVELATTSKATYKDTPNTNEHNLQGIACKYCWLFMLSDKCSICKTSKNKIDLTDNFEDNPNKTVEIYPNNIHKQYNTAKIDVNLTKRLKTWQCPICLIKNNIDKERCNCCDAKLLTNKEMFNFNKIVCNKTELNNNNENINEIHETIAKESEELNNIVAIEPKELYKTIVKEPEELNKTIYLETKKLDTNTSTNVAEPTQYNLTVNTTVPKNINIDILSQDSSHMDTEIYEEVNSIHFGNSFNNNIEPETMDFEETDIHENTSQKPETLKHTYINFNMPNALFNMSDLTDKNMTPASIEKPTNIFPTQQIQFTIGSSSGEKQPRKYKRAARNNMFRAFHK